MLADILWAGIAAVISALLIALVYASFSRTKIKNLSATSPDLKCSFCKKSQEDVRKLIAGPTVFICDECVDVCSDILAAELESEGIAKVAGGRLVADPVSWSARSMAARCALCKKPVSTSDSFMIEPRGLVCSRCVDALKAAVAKQAPRNESDS